MDEKMIAWAAGLFEGEGYTRMANPINIIQKDTWILYKLKELFGGVINSTGNECYVWQIYGPEGRSLLKLFMPYLSPRRLKQIEDNKVFSILRENNTCLKGHEFTPYNTIYKSNGDRTCRICDKNYRRIRRFSLRGVA